MKAKTFLMVAALFILVGVLGGCYYGAYDDYRDYGYRSDSYREGFRDGRAYERRNEARRDSRYSSDSWRWRW